MTLKEIPPIPFSADGKIMQRRYPGVSYKENHMFTAELTLMGWAWENISEPFMTLKDKKTKIKYSISTFALLDIMKNWVIFQGKIPRTQWTFACKNEIYSIKLAAME